MTPNVALLLWLVLLVALFCFDPAREPKVSAALWVPVIWLFIAGSRLPSVWLSGGQAGTIAGALQEGNPLDRTFWTGLIVLAFGILVSRSFNWTGFFRRNFALTAFLCFALLSVVWSDFPDVALKRWFRDSGAYLAILVVATDPRPLDAVRTVLRRFTYLIIPLSILLIKYYPQFGKRYDFWTGQGFYTGASTSKNMLGVLCLLSGLFLFWDTLTRWSDRKQRRLKSIIMVNVALLAMTLWLLHIADSATSRTCLALGCLVIAAAHSQSSQRRPGLLKVLVPASFLAYAALAFGFGLKGDFASAVGRNSTLTDRTLIWNAVLSVHTNALVGTGYQSFWLGPRLAEVWKISVPGINEAHDGYLETYLNLGYLGLCLLVGFLIASYRNICRRLDPLTSLGSLTFALWVVLLFYNVTEAALGGGLLWLTLLPGALNLAENKSAEVLDDTCASDQSLAARWS